jgi:UDP-N-acetylglucosamine 4,6-dehydratase
MRSFILKYISHLLGMNRSIKNLLLMTVDYLVLTFSFWAALSIRLNEFYFAPTNETKLLMILAPLIALPIFYSFGLYRSMVRYSGYKSIRIIIIGVSVYTIFWFMAVLATEVVNKPYDFLAINWLLSIYLVGGLRIFIRRALTQDDSQSTKALIYGAGAAGIQLKSAIEYSPETKVVGFIDDDPKLQGLDIEGRKVYSPLVISKLIEEKLITHIFLALPSLSKSEKQLILQALKKYPLKIRSLPDLSDLVEGRISVSDLKKIKIADLLGRTARKPNDILLKRDIDNKNILVTGAGGSIGSELCREIILQKPNKLVLFDISEYAIYLLERDLSDSDCKIEIIPMVGNVYDGKNLEKVFKSFAINTIYHAAAYKHVPLVEKNIIEAVKVNIFGTLSCINAAINSGVNSFVFISTDKAVRPTNIMGATKRFAELILKSKALISKSKDGINTRVSIVRFGNVLGSSGSVVPLFEKQIQQGGPITVTDPNIIRYFMTVKEASQLVIQSGAIGTSGDIFVLDMGEQIKILQLAEDMIRLSGRTIKNEENPEGDIEILFTGLRPGEKLYEELNIGSKLISTEHKKIMKAEEEETIWEDMQVHLETLKLACSEYDYETIEKVFIENVVGFKHDHGIIDSIEMENRE